MVTQVNGSRMVKAEVFAQLFRRYTDVPVIPVPDVAAAFDTACASRAEDGILFCAGSLYMIGELKKLILMRRVQND